MTDRDLPWENKGDAATRRAIARAQRNGKAVSPPGGHPYAEGAFRDEIEGLARTTTGERNNRLNIAALKLGEFVAADALDEQRVRLALLDACRVNGLVDDDGERTVLATIESGMSKGLKQPRAIPKLKPTKVSQQPTIKLEVDGLEGDFWTCRDSLKTIYIAALSQMSSPWAVLGCCVARALALVRPNTVLPPLIGGVGSLNWFGAIAAPSGGGKGSAAAVAQQLVNDYVMQRNLGSGEGIIDAYIRPADKETKQPRGMHESIMFMVDEIDTLMALKARSGNTMSSILRSGFSGETLGFSYRNASSTHLAAQSYRMTLMVSVQPGRAGALVDDSYGGTLQRFMWFPGIDARVTVDRPTMPGALNLPAYSAYEYSRVLQLPDHATNLILSERAKAMRGEQDALDGHALFIREKLAYALAVLDGRAEMSVEDWRLAGIACAVSDHTRAWVQAELEIAAKEDAVKRGALMGVSSAAADDEKTQAVTERQRRIAQWILAKLPATQRELTQGIFSRDRPYLASTLERLESAGKIRSATAKRRNGQQVKQWVKDGS